MFESNEPRVAIVDYGMGNLFSVKNACEHVGLAATITDSSVDLLTADAVILPGVGAFGDAMDTLRRLDLVFPLLDFVASLKPLLGVCLGQQLLMSESYEFGHHTGLGLITGCVNRFDNPVGPYGVLKVPQVGWNQLYRTGTSTSDPWEDTPLKGLPDGVHMYFVHSFYVQPTDPGVSIAMTRYGNIEFCSALAYRNIFACQCHPERSGPLGLQVYRNLATRLHQKGWRTAND